LKRFQIVLVEDVPTDAELLRRAMQQMLPEAEIVTFGNAEAAQSYLAAIPQSHTLRLAIVDIKLPGMRGDDLIRWMRTQSILRALPVIALSGSATLVERDRPRLDPSTVFWSKPSGYNGYIDLVYHIQEEYELSNA
jgi:CheY-like chemotaxis protein